MSSQAYQQPSQSTAVNGWSVTSLVLAIACLAVLVFTGIAVMAVFAVGAGHIALGQLREHCGRGVGLARAGLAIGYAVGIWAIALAVVSLGRLLV